MEKKHNNVICFFYVEETDHVVVLFLHGTEEFPSRLKGIFKRLFLGNATCVKCGSQTSEIILRDLSEHGSKTKRRVFHIVCNCGYPVWRISQDACFEVEYRIRTAGYSQENAQHRKESLIEAGGKHSKTEIQEILALQENRCIYCNIIFTNKVLPTKDHLLPIARGGTDWALNIVMACRRCNSRRSTLPFRTYCKLLSATQNRRILNHLRRRLSALGLDQPGIGYQVPVLRSGKPQTPSRSFVDQRNRDQND